MVYASPGPRPIAARELRTIGATILFISAYFADGEGLAGSNVEMPEEIPCKILALNASCIWAAAWNMKVVQART